MLSDKGYKFPEIFLSPATSSHISTQDLFFPYMHRLTLSAIYTQAVHQPNGSCTTESFCFSV